MVKLIPTSYSIRKTNKAGTLAALRYSLLQNYNLYICLEGKEPCCNFSSYAAITVVNELDSIKISNVN